MSDFWFTVPAQQNGAGCSDDGLLIGNNRAEIARVELDMQDSTFQDVFRKRLGEKELKRILLVVPPDADSDSFSFDIAKKKRYWNYPPYGLGLIAARARAEGLEAKILNLNNLILESCLTAESADSFAYDTVISKALEDEVESFHPDFIGLTCMFSLTHQSAKQVCSKIRALVPEVVIGIGGVHISNSFTEEVMRQAIIDDFSDVDVFFLFEADIAFRDFCRAVNGTLPVDELGQIVFIDGNRHYQPSISKKPSGIDLDLSPALDLMDIPRLIQSGRISNFSFLLNATATEATVLSNRGCSGQCTFCSVRNFNGVGVRGRSIQAVIDEILALRHDHGVDHIMWLDDDLLYDGRRAITLFNEMDRQDVGVTWDATNGLIASSVTDELMRAAAASGCIGVFIGMESGNPQTLREIRKPGTVRNFLNAAEILRNIECIYSRVYLMIGFPGETHARIIDTLNVASEMRLDWCSIQVLQPLQNTPIFSKIMSDKAVKSADFGSMNFSGGPHGKSARGKTNHSGFLSESFMDIFNNIDLETIPSSTNLKKILSYMDFKLNYCGLIREERPLKLRQQARWLGQILNVIDDRNAAAMHCLLRIEHLLGDKTYDGLQDRYLAALSHSPYWREILEQLDAQRG